MGSPADAVDRLKATYDWGGLAVQGWVYSHLDLDAQILDVGAGWGKYRDLLPDYENMDAVEIWDPYVESESLAARYRQVYTMDVADMHPHLMGIYDVVIFGDVLEHLKQQDAFDVLDRCFQALVIVPFLFEQGEEQGNPYEAHLQPDLTMDVMERRYPMLRLEGVEIRDGHPFKGFYLKEGAWEREDG